MFDDDFTGINDLASLQNEYFTVSCADEPASLLNTFAQKRIHRGNWLEFFLNRDLTEYLQYMDASRLNAAGIIIEDVGGQGHVRKIIQAIENNGTTYVPGLSCNEGQFRTWLQMVSRFKSKTDVLKQELMRAIAHMTIRVIRELWVAYGGTGALYCIMCGPDGGYHTNRVNPFHVDYLFDEMDCFGKVVKPDGDLMPLLLLPLASSTTSTSMGVVFTVHGKPLKVTALPALEKYSAIALDFNGSYAFYNHHSTYINAAINSHACTGVFMMGGVEANSPPKTLMMYNIFRVSCATINQVYSPANTSAFLNAVGEAQQAQGRCLLHVGTNNFINGDTTLDILGKDSEVEPVSMHRFFDIHSAWLQKTPNDETIPRITVDVIFAYYALAAKPFKIFDVPVAMALVDSLDKLDQPIQYTAKLYFDAKYAVSILDVPSSGPSCKRAANARGSAQVAERQWDDVRSCYFDGLSSKFHEMFEKSIKFECGVLNQVQMQQLPAVDISSSWKELQAKFSIKREPDQVPDQVPDSPPKPCQPINYLPRSEEDVVYAFEGPIYAFSDEEGGAPFGDGIHPELKSAFQVEDGLIDGLSFGSNLIFLGDVQDNSQHNIRIMLNMLKLKTESVDKVILIGGNRDYNKVRMADEYYMTVTVDSLTYPAVGFPWSTVIGHARQELPPFQEVVWKLVEDIVETKTNRFNYDFMWKEEQLVYPTLTGTPWHKMNHALFNKSLDQRVNRTYLDTFGAFNDDPKAPQFYGVPDRTYVSMNTQTSDQFIFQELIDMGLYSAKYGVEQKDQRKVEVAAAVSLFNMFASRVWKDPGFKMRANGWKDLTKELNGLYVNYIAKCEICALFYHGGHYGFVSHAGMTTFEEKLTNELGVAYDLSVLREKLLRGEATNFPNKEVSLVEIVRSYKGFMVGLATEITRPQECSGYFQAPSNVNTSGNSKNSKNSKNAAQPKKILAPELFRQSKMVQHIIHMSAGTKYRIEGPLVMHHAMSPIVSFRNPKGQKKRTPIAINANITHEGGHSEYLKSLNVSNLQYAALAHDGTDDRRHVTWNIYGHQPRGVVPAVSADASRCKTTYNICMDVSKIEGQANDHSYAVLCINMGLSLDPTTSTTFMGKIDLRQNVPRRLKIMTDADTDTTTRCTPFYSFENRGVYDEFPYEDTSAIYTSYTASLQKLLKDQAQRVEYNWKVVHDFNKGLKEVCQETTTTYSIRGLPISGRKYDVAYASEFMGAAPWPVFNNFLFLTKSRSRTGALNVKGEVRHSFSAESETWQLSDLFTYILFAPMQGGRRLKGRKATSSKKPKKSEKTLKAKKTTTTKK